MFNFLQLLTLTTEYCTVHTSKGFLKTVLPKFSASDMSNIKEKIVDNNNQNFSHIETTDINNTQQQLQHYHISSNQDSLISYNNNYNDDDWASLGNNAAQAKNESKVCLERFCRCCKSAAKSQRGYTNSSRYKVPFIDIEIPRVSKFF